MALTKKGGFSFGDYIALQMQLQGITQQELADEFNTYQGNISKKISEGKLRPEEYSQLAKKLNCKDIMVYAVYKQIEPLVERLM